MKDENHGSPSSTTIPNLNRLLRQVSPKHPPIVTVTLPHCSLNDRRKTNGSVKTTAEIKAVKAATRIDFPRPPPADHHFPPMSSAVSTEHLPQNYPLFEFSGDGH